MVINKISILTIFLVLLFGKLYFSIIVIDVMKYITKLDAYFSRYVNSCSSYSINQNHCSDHRTLSRLRKSLIMKISHSPSVIEPKMFIAMLILQSEVSENMCNIVRRTENLHAIWIFGFFTWRINDHNWHSYIIKCDITCHVNRGNQNIDISYLDFEILLLYLFWCD